MSNNTRQFVVRPSGNRIVVIVNADAPDERAISECRRELAEAMEAAHATEVAFELANAPAVTSDVLGLMVCVSQSATVIARNPSPHAIEKLRITRLDTIFTTETGLPETSLGRFPRVFRSDDSRGRALGSSRTEFDESTIIASTRFPTRRAVVT